MRRRAHYPQIRELTPDETGAAARWLNEHWPGRATAHVHIEWNNQLVIEWQAGSGPVIEQRFPLAHLAVHAVPIIADVPAEQHSTNYRQDRAGEYWHIIPDNEHGLKGRALCGAPRQGTRLSEAHANVPPSRERMCRHCLEQLDSALGKDHSNVLVSTAV
jgi:hypothetical protein